MEKKTIYHIKKRLLLFAACIVAGGGLVPAGSVLSQDYIETPSGQASDSGSSSGTPSSKSSSKETMMDTEYEKRLRENIQNQLKAQQQTGSSAAADDEDSSGTSAADTAADESDSGDELSINCGTVSSTVISITDAVAQASGSSSAGTQAGTTLTSLIKSISESYSSLPSEVGCADGATVTNVENDAKQAFQDEFLRQCRTMVSEAQQAYAQGGINGYNSYISSKLSDMSYSTLNTAINTACSTRGTYDSSDSSSGSGSSGSGSSNSNSGSGTTTTTVEETTTTTTTKPLVGYYNAPNGTFTGDGASDDNNLSTADAPPQQSVPPIDPSHNDNPPGVSYGEDARWLAIQSSHEPGNYAKCVFSANNSIVPDCKRKFDKVLWDWRQKITMSIDAGTYLILSEICKRGGGSGCKEGDSNYIQINSGYRSPATNALVKGASSSQHMKAKAVDFVIPGMSPAKSADVCQQIGKGGCGKYGTFTHEDSGPVRKWNG